MPQENKKLMKHEWFHSLGRYDDEWYSEVQCTCGDQIEWEGADDKLDVWIQTHYKRCYLKKLEENNAK